MDSRLHTASKLVWLVLMGPTVTVVVIVSAVTVVGLDGRLQKASKLKGIKNFRASDKGLLPVDVATWQGFTFINASNKRCCSSSAALLMYTNMLCACTL